MAQIDAFLQAHPIRGIGSPHVSGSPVLRIAVNSAGKVQALETTAQAML